MDDLHEGILLEFVQRSAVSLWDDMPDGFIIFLPAEDRSLEQQSYYARYADHIREQRKMRYAHSTGEQRARQNALRAIRRSVARKRTLPK